MQSQQLAEYFTHAGIRITGDPFNPLFAAVDVASKIGDMNQTRKLKSYNKKHLTTAMSKDKSGREVEMKFLTEKGLYKYLMQSKRPEAEAFQDWVIDRLCEIRRQVIDNAQLEAKIARDAERLAIARADDLSESLFMLTTSTYDDRPVDACNVGMANHYIAKYLMHSQLKRDQIPELTHDILCRIASTYFRQGMTAQEEYQDVVIKILDQLATKHGFHKKLE